MRTNDTDDALNDTVADRHADTTCQRICQIDGISHRQMQLTESLRTGTVCTATHKLSFSIIFFLSDLSHAFSANGRSEIHKKIENKTRFLLQTRMQLFSISFPVFQSFRWTHVTRYVHCVVQFVIKERQKNASNRVRWRDDIFRDARIAQQAIVKWFRFYHLQLMKSRDSFDTIRVN